MKVPIEKIDEIKNYILAGKATFTLENGENGDYVTFKVVEFKENLHFVQYMNGNNNEEHYAYLGTIFNKSTFKVTKKSPNTDTKCVKGFNWLWKKISTNSELDHPMSFFHSGHCGKCGRTLTTPDSIRFGIGPVCRNIHSK